MPELKGFSPVGRPEARTLRCLVWLLVLLLTALPGVPASGAAEPESGVFVILSGGRRLGTERYTITPGSSGWEAAGELQLEVPSSPKVSERCSLRVNANLQPVSYERRQEVPKKGILAAKFEAAGTTLTSQTETGSQEQIFLLPDHDLVVLDTNFFHHYEFLIRLYDLARPGPQSFTVFIPQEALPDTISLAFQGKANLPGGNVPGGLDYYLATTEDFTIEIWATPGREIQRLLIPKANLEVVRQK